MSDIPSFSGQPLGALLQTLSPLTTPPPEQETLSAYIVESDTLQRSQTFVSRVFAPSGDERAGVSLLLALLLALREFQELAGQSQNLPSQSQFLQDLLSKETFLKWLVGAISDVQWIVAYRPYDLYSCFVGERWKEHKIIDIPEAEDYDIDMETSQDFIDFETLVFTSDRLRTAIISRTQRPTVPLSDTLLLVSITWNVAGLSLKSEAQIGALFSPILEHRPHIIFLGLQEIFECKSHNMGKILANSAKQEEGSIWQTKTEAVLKRIDPGYHLVTSQTNGASQLLLFSLLPKETTKDFGVVKTNLGVMGGMIANKGGVSINLVLQETKIQFTVCHLDSGESKKNYESRLTQLRCLMPTAIEKEVPAEKKKNKGGFLKSSWGLVSGLVNSNSLVPDQNLINFAPDVIILLGDLNFRVTMDFLDCMKIITKIKQEKPKGEELNALLKKILKHDQLSIAMAEKSSMNKLQESPICFMPTYKQEENADLYSRTKERTPSWTDRVLAFSNTENQVKLLEYSSLPFVYGSDHRPVYSVSMIKLNKNSEPKE